jgi:cytochrome o ubiquinol oxidase operon protein cyoD
MPHDEQGVHRGTHNDPNLEIEDDGSTNPQSYLGGLALAILLTLASFGAARFHLVWGPGLPILLAVLAIAQMGVHLVFFLHISSAPDQTNNFLALAFGIFVVGLIVFGSMIIMANLNHAMMPMDRLMQMQR